MVGGVKSAAPIPRLGRRAFLVGAGGLAAAAALGAGISENPPPYLEARVREAITAGLVFLTTPLGAGASGQYNSSLGLLREAPAAAPCKYWLFNDNALAAHALRVLGHPLSDVLWATLRRWGHERNGLHEVLWGVNFGDPPKHLPRTHHYYCLRPAGEDGLCSSPCADGGPDLVCLDVRDGHEMTDWGEYADLALYVALNRRLLGDLTGARQAFDIATDSIDWARVGFADLAYNPEAGHETYKVALALHTGILLALLSEEQRQALVGCLLARQDAGAPGKVGGFYTHYLGSGRPSDVNTETTSLVLLALSTHLHSPRPYFPL